MGVQFSLHHLLKTLLCSVQLSQHPCQKSTHHNGMGLFLGSRFDFTELCLALRQLYPVLVMVTLQELSRILQFCSHISRSFCISRDSYEFEDWLFRFCTTASRGINKDDLGSVEVSLGTMAAFRRLSLPTHECRRPFHLCRIYSTSFR